MSRSTNSPRTTSGTAKQSTLAAAAMAAAGPKLTIPIVTRTCTRESTLRMPTAMAHARAAPAIPRCGMRRTHSPMSRARAVSELIRLSALRPDISSRVSAGPVETEEHRGRHQQDDGDPVVEEYSDPNRPR